jgi:translation initiation factor 2B subunit (eIF-2B alpha/beta/delta family)
VATELTTITVTYSEAIEDIAASDIKDEVKLFDNTGASVEITGSTVIEGNLVLTVGNSSVVTKLTTVVVDESGLDSSDIMDAVGNIQKSGLTINT